MIQENIKIVQEKINKACERAGRKQSEVTLIAVSKTKPLSMIEEAYAAGMSEFGENKPQEMRDKAKELDVPVHWHMIGTLQTNKIKYVVGTACMIHSVDSLSLALAIEKEAAKKDLVMDILLEVNMAKEESKHGFSEDEIYSVVPEIAKMPHLSLRGLMTVAPYTENAEENRIYFRKMKELLVDINSKNIDNISMDSLSMGMSSDYEVAIEEGATMVRVGTGIFGERDYSL
ncbi:MAG: YggS family pyridoxal phosphate-dependent enzyme [Lachnospiraceae bacterium]|nr:YggS family pyridoxal phosphate-dependent enzyme [Lachnospiraceae bacterium]MBQ7864016.1 YggS family pyridoxal phosphate-dependent enzyme [Lachnospiraceae bacterium]MBQ8633935.1 YggS family pyridoxal phosphate-dependent enzyme [Lachnospiraceae bacterium]